MAYVSSVERMALKKGLEQGRQEGRQEAEITFLIRILAHKFGDVSHDFKIRIKQADAETLLAWGERVLDAKTIEEVFG